MTICVKKFRILIFCSTFVFIVGLILSIVIKTNNVNIRKENCDEYYVAYKSNNEFMRYIYIFDDCTIISIKKRDIDKCFVNNHNCKFVDGYEKKMLGNKVLFIIFLTFSMLFFTISMFEICVEICGCKFDDQ